MNPRYLLILPVFAMSQGAFAADAADASPYDKNPACMDTATDSSAGKCVIQTEGTPRHKYPPPGPAAAARNPGGAAGAAGTTGSAKSGSASRNGGSAGK